MNINSLLKSPAVQPKDMTFDELHEAIEKNTLWRRPGAQIRFKAGELYLKLFSLNPLGNKDARSEKFVGAANIIRNAIDRQFGYQTVDHRTVGQYVVDQLALSRGGSRQLEYGDLGKVHQIIQQAREKYDLALEDKSAASRASLNSTSAGRVSQGGPAAGESLQQLKAESDAALSGVSASRVSPSELTAREGAKLLQAAIFRDAVEGDEDNSYTHKQYEEAAARIMEKLGGVKSSNGDFFLKGGLSSENIQKAVQIIRTENDKGGQFIDIQNVVALLEVTNLQQRIDVAGNRLNALNHRLDTLAAEIPSLQDSLTDIKDVTQANREIIQELRTLSYPNDLFDNSIRADVHKKLIENCENAYSRICERVDSALENESLGDSERRRLEECRKLAPQQFMETLSLASAFLNDQSYMRHASVGDKIDRTGIEAMFRVVAENVSMDETNELLNLKLEVPKTLYSKKGREDENSLEHMIGTFNTVMTNILRDAARFEDIDTDDRVEFANKLQNAMAQCDALMESLPHLQRVRGKLDDKEAASDLEKLQQVRFSLQCLGSLNQARLASPEEVGLEPSNAARTRSNTLDYLNSLGNDFDSGSEPDEHPDARSNTRADLDQSISSGLGLQVDIDD